MVHSVSGWTRGVQVKLWDPLRTRVIPECLRGMFTTRRYTNPCLLLPLPLHSDTLCICSSVWCVLSRYKNSSKDLSQWFDVQMSCCVNVSNWRLPTPLPTPLPTLLLVTSPLALLTDVAMIRWCTVTVTSSQTFQSWLPWQPNPFRNETVSLWVAWQPRIILFASGALIDLFLLVAL